MSGFEDDARGFALDTPPMHRRARFSLPNATALLHSFKGMAMLEARLKPSLMTVRISRPNRIKPRAKTTVARKLRMVEVDLEKTAAALASRRDLSATSEPRVTAQGHGYETSQVKPPEVTASAMLMLMPMPIPMPCCPPAPSSAQCTGLSTVPCFPGSCHYLVGDLRRMSFESWHGILRRSTRAMDRFRIRPVAIRSVRSRHMIMIGPRHTAGCRRYFLPPRAAPHPQDYTRMTHGMNDQSSLSVGT